MKPITLASLTALLLGLLPAARGVDTTRVIKGYFNATTNTPIDAVNLQIASGAQFWSIDPNLQYPYNSSDTRTLTNFGTMTLAPGLEFRTTFTDTTAYWTNVLNGVTNKAWFQVWDQPADSFVNGDGGIIQVVGAYYYYGSGNNIYAQPYSTAKLLADSGYIRNAGTMKGDQFSLVRLRGNDLDLSHGMIDLTQSTVVLGGTNYNLGSLYMGWQDNYWGTATGNTNTMVPAALFGGGFAEVLSSYETGVTNRYYDKTFAPLILNAPKAYQLYQYPVDNSGSNFMNMYVFLQEGNPVFSNSVALDPNAGIYVQWQWVSTNWPSGELGTNYLYLNDRFGEETNFGVVPNGFNGPNPTYIPHNYTFGSFPGGLIAFPMAPTSAVNLPVQAVTNDATSYEAYFTPLVQLTTDTAGNITNLPGRIELVASNSLDLTGATILAPSYLLLRAEQQYQGSANATISTPTAELYLRTTNGTFTMTNLIAPYVNHLVGPVDLWSARWTNITAGVTNGYHILLVNSSLSPVANPVVQNIQITATNAPVTNRGDIFISDIMNIYGNLVLDARSITLLTNGPGAQSPEGELNFLNADSIYPTSTPGLKYLTNWGQISSAGAIFFGGTTVSNTADLGANNPPYRAFVNHGLVNDLSSTIWSQYFENTGVFETQYSFELTSGITTVVTNGIISALLGPISLDTGYLMLNAATLSANATITLNVAGTNWLSDGVPNLGWAARLDTNGVYMAGINTNALLTPGVTNASAWSCGGLNVLAKPAGGDLLGTTITVSAAPGQVAYVRWPSEDRGPSASGFVNNLAIGRLVLNGQGFGSTFVITNNTGAKGALYIDDLVLAGTAMNDTNGTWPNIIIAPNMTVYFGLANNPGFTEHLDGASGKNTNGGKFVWLSGYNLGYYSGTNLVYSDGTTNRVNLALALSADLDSNGNGIVNRNDGKPITIDSNYYAAVLATTNNLPLTQPAVPFIDEILFPGGGSTNGGGTTNNPSTNTTAVVSVPRLDAHPANPSGSSTNPVGTYSGLFADTNKGVGLASSGFASATVTTRGGYSGKLQLAGKSFSFSGQLTNLAGVSTIKRSGDSALVLSLQAIPSSDQLRGWVSNSVPTNAANAWVAELITDRVVWNARTNKAPAASYTLVVPPTTNTASAPAGYGFGTLKVSTVGAITWSGTLADGTKVTQGSTLSRDGYWPFYSSLYSGKGLALSWMLFGTNAANGELAGELIWLKSRGASTTSYPGGFTNDTVAVGSTYTNRGGLGATNGTVVLTGAGLNHFSSAFLVKAGNRISSTTNKLTLSFTAANGLFSGSVVNSNKVKLGFQGVWLQNQTNGFGYFLNGAGSGAVDLSPAP